MAALEDPLASAATAASVSALLANMTNPPAAETITEAVTAAAALIRSYTRSRITYLADDVAWLQGTHARRLVLGERPLTAVASVRLDGTLLDASDYRWQRNGSLWRSAGWGGPDHDVEVTSSHGFLVVPTDLAAVCRTAAARFASNPEQLTREEVEGYSAVASTPTGFTVGELLVLDRYRRRTWP